MIKTVLLVKNLSKQYKKRIAVDNVSFDIFEGEIFGLIGPNGAGKTTIIKMITGLATPTKGEVFICDTPLTTNFEKAISYVGGIIENPELYSYMTGRQNLEYFASLYSNITENEIDSIIDLIGMANRIDDKVKTYSLGMKQRIGIAQALLNKPKLLILDEPTNGLDPNGINEMREFLKKLSREKKIAILISSHILSEMEQLCDTVGIISNGKIVDLKTIEQIRIGLKKEQKTCIKVDYPNFAGKLIETRYNTKVELAGKSIIFNVDEKLIPEITSFLINEHLSIFGVNQITKTLEEVFLEIVNKNNSTSIL